MTKHLLMLLKILALGFGAVFAALALAEFPEPVSVADFQINAGPCYPSIPFVSGRVSNSIGAACSSMVYEWSKIGASCGDTYTADEKVVVVTRAYLGFSQNPSYNNCHVTTTILVPGYDAVSNRTDFGHYYTKYSCKKIDPQPKSYAEWLKMVDRPIGLDCPDACPVEPLKAITDADAIRFENGDNIRLDRLTQNTRNRLQCLQNAVTRERPAGTLTVTSAWRPQSYQNHLKEIVDKIALLTTDANRQNQSCTPIRQAIEAERVRHGLGTVVGRTSNHTAGNAFDASWANISTARIDVLAAACGLSRPIPNDPVHFQ